MRYAAVLAVMALWPQDKVSLKWKLEKGQVLRYTLVEKRVVEHDAFPLEIENTFVLKQTVTEVDDRGQATCAISYETVAFKVSGFVGESEYDSTKDKKAPDDPVGQAVSGLVGQTFSMKLAAGGKIVSVSGFDKICAKMCEPLGDDGADMTKGFIQQIYNDKAQQALLQQAYLILPGEPVTTGDAWKSDFPFDMGMLGSYSFLLTSSLKDVKGDAATLAQDVKVQASTGEGAMLELSEGKGKSEGAFDLAKGRLNESRTDVELKLKMGDGEFPVKLNARLKLQPDAAK